MWALGGEFIRDLHSDSSLGTKPVELVLRQMIDRASLARLTLTADQVEAAMINALKALALLRDPESLPLVENVRGQRCGEMSGARNPIRTEMGPP